MGIPASLALDVKAPHGLVAAEEVLEGARQNVVGRGLAVGCGRPFVEDEAGPARPELQRFLERALLLPGRHQLLLELWEADLLIYRIKHAFSR